MGSTWRERRTLCRQGFEKAPLVYPSTRRWRVLEAEAAGKGVSTSSREGDGGVVGVGSDGAVRRRERGSRAWSGGVAVGAEKGAAVMPRAR
nr:unnamed protein product [Digitaria exilis]